MPKKQKRKALAWEEIQIKSNAEIKAATDYISQKKQGDRGKRWDRYYGRPIGKVRKGRSSYQSHDIMDAVEWMLPGLIRVFASGDPKIEIEIKDKPPEVGKALMRKIQDDLGNHDVNNLFQCFYVWFKDALVSDTAFVKPLWDLDYKTKVVDFDQLGLSEMMTLDQDPDVELRDYQETQGPPGPDGMPTQVFTGVKAKVKMKRRDGIFVENMPHWEFICEPRARSMNDEHGKGHQTKVTVDYLKRMDRAYMDEDGKPFFKGLPDLIMKKDSKSQSLAYGKLDGEEANYRGEDYYANHPAFFGASDEALKSEIEFTEWYTRLDVDGDGFLEDVIIWSGDDVLLRWEINEDEMIPMCGISPILDCYKFFGISWAELVNEIQVLKTQLFRRVLDNFAWQNKGRWFIKPGALVDVDKLLNGIPGEPVFVDPDSARQETPAGFQSNVIPLFEYIEGQKENRTGQTRYNQGQDADTLNKTASGIAMIQSAAQQRMELVARVFAETGIRDLYEKIVKLYQRHLAEPFTAKVQGKDIQVSREMIQGRIITRVNMGVEAQVGMIEAQKIERMFQFLMGVNQAFPGLLSPEKIHNLATRYIASMGFRQTEDFVQELDAYVQQVQQMMQMQQQMAQQKMQMEGAKVQTDATRVAVEKEEGERADKIEVWKELRGGRSALTELATIGQRQQGNGDRGAKAGA